MKKKSTRVILYTRVSTQEQAGSGLGLADQRKTLEIEADRRGWKDTRYIADEGFSAKSLARPGISEALADLAAGRASTLVVSKLDRLSRSLLDFANLMETAKRQGWEIVVLDMAVDTTTPSGQLMASVMAILCPIREATVRGSYERSASRTQVARGSPRSATHDV